MAGAQPPSRPTTFVHGLPDDLVLSILGRVPCKEDRVKTSLVCKAWRDKIARLIPPPPPLPWLLLPSSERNGPSRVVCVLSDCHGHDYLTINPPGERFVGSYDGAWIFLYSDRTRTHRLLNARTRQVRVLPSDLLRDNLEDPTHYHMVILAATLSSSPDEAKCVCAAIVARDHQARDELVLPVNRRVAFWRMGWELAYQIVTDDLDMYLTEDVVYHDGAFHFLLTHGGAYQIHECTADVDDPEDPMALEVNWEVRRFIPPLAGGQNAFVRGRYLVVSGGELLMIVRFTTDDNLQTSNFMVFRATKRPEVPEPDDAFPVAEFPWAWSELDTLNGRILFIGYGCSRSYQANEYPGFKPGIYFLDDGMFYEALIFGFASIRPYPCRDNGMWSDGRIQRCFPRENSSPHSPLVWLLP